MKIKKESKGITLIALVITIIVLLILAGVSISMLSGENGILNRATEASQKTKETVEQEELQLAIAGLEIDYYAEKTGKTFGEYIFENIDKIKEELGKSSIDADKNAKTITYKGKKYQVTDDGEVKLLNGGSTEGGEETKWKAILADANANPDSYKHEETLTSEYIAIGTDGQPVNMDLWNPTKLEDGTWGLNAQIDDQNNIINEAYQGEFKGGKIVGTVPQYIYDEDSGSFTAVTQMYSTFKNQTDLVYAPEIPSSVTSLESTFYGCTNLTSITIPDSVTNIGEYAFHNCTNLTSITIPTSVTNIGIDAFSSCSGLTNITIPASVTNMENCVFFDCTGLGSVKYEGRQYTNRDEIENALINSGVSCGSSIFAYTALEGEDSTCLAEGTLITLADGKQVPIEQLTGDEKVLIWNMETGTYDEAQIAYINNHNNISKERKIIHAYFSDGTDIEIINDHGFYDIDLNKYIYINANNYEEYIGDWFVKQVIGSDNTWDKVQLIDVRIEYRMTRTYEIVTYEHLSCYTNGLLSISALLEPFCNMFEFDSNTLSYNKELKAKDIEEYGLFTYDDFEGLVSEYTFKLYHFDYLKVSMGKGLITWNKLLILIDYYNSEIAPLVKETQY